MEPQTVAISQEHRSRAELLLLLLRGLRLRAERSFLPELLFLKPRVFTPRLNEELGAPARVSAMLTSHIATQLTDTGVPGDPGQLFQHPATRAEDAHGERALTCGRVSLERKISFGVPLGSLRPQDNFANLGRLFSSWVCVCVCVKPGGVR